MLSDKAIPQSINRVYPPQNVIPGCVLHYDFQDLGSTIIDHSGSGNHGIVIGAVVKSGLNGYERYCDGVDDYIVKDETNRSVLNNLANDSFTISVWYKQLTNTGAADIVSKLGSSTQTSFALRVQANNTFLFMVSSDGTTTGRVILYETNTTLVSGKYYNIVCRFDATKANSINNLNNFVNGVKGSTSSLNCNAVFKSNLALKIATYSNVYLNCNIGQLQFYNRALADTEITQLFQQDAWRFGQII